MSTNGDAVTMIATMKEAIAALPIPESGAAAMEEADALLEVVGLLNLAVEQRVRKVDCSREAKAAGYSSTASWLRSGGRMNTYAASALRRNGRQFDRLPDTVAALENGRISHAMAAVIAAAVRVLPDSADVSQTERILLDLALSDQGTVEKVTRVGKYLQQVLDPDGSLRDEEKAHRKRHLSVHHDEHGGMSGSFYLPPEPAARLQAVLDKYAGPKTAGDERCQTQRNADAFAQLLDEQVDTELLVVVNAETLPDDDPSTEPEAEAEPEPERSTPGLLMATGHPLPAAHIKRLARTSTLYRLVVSANGKAWDLGDGVRLVPGWMRRAILALYDTCAYDDCPVPARLCQLDHVRDWARFKRTNFDEIAPACAFHNRDRAQHPGRYTITKRPDGRWHLTSSRGRRR